MKRIINIRPFFIAFLGLILGILFFNFIWLSAGVSSIVASVFLGLIILLSIVATVFAYLLKNTNFNLKKQWFLLFVVFCLIGFCLIGLRSAYYNFVCKNYEGEFNVIGQIEDNYYSNSDYTVITLNKVVISNQEKSHKLPSKLKVVIYGQNLPQFDASYLMEFNAIINKTPFTNLGFNFSQYNNNVVYSVTITTNSYNFYKDKFSLDEKVRNAYLTKLNQNMPKESANLAYSLLFGGDENLSEEIKNIFSQTGVVHIISVSGLHVAVLVAFILFVLKLCKVKKQFQFYIIFVVLLFYSYLCGFVPSVLRASFMSLVLLLALMLGKRYDALSALSFSGIVILFINPVQLFSIGFQLSFVCIFAIITIVPFLNLIFKNTKLPKWLYTSVNVTISVSLLTYPILAHHFNEFAIYSVLGNLFAVPIMSFAYVLIFVFTTISLILPVGIILKIPQVLLHFSKIILQNIASLPFSVLRVFSDGYISLLLLLIFAFIVKFVMINNKNKAILSSLLLVLVILFGTLYNLPVNYKINALTINYQQDSNIAFFSTSEGEHILVGSAYNQEKYFDKLVNELKINKINTIIAYDYAYKYKEKLIDLCKKFKVENLYLPTQNDNSLIYDSFNFLNVVLVNEDVVTENYSFNFIYNENLAIAINFNIFNKKFLFVKSGLTVDNLRTISSEKNSYYNYVIINNIYVNLNNYNIYAENLITQKNNATLVEDSIYNLKQLTKINIKF